MELAIAAGVVVAIIFLFVSWVRRGSSIARLRQDVADRDKRIAAEAGRAGQLKSEVDRLEGQVREKGDELEAQSEELAKKHRQVRTKDGEIRKQTEQINNLRAELSVLHRALDQMGVALVTLDPAGAVRFANAPAASLGAAVETSLARIFHPDDGKYFDTSTAGASAWNFDVRLADKDSSSAFVRSALPDKAIPSVNARCGDRVAMLLPITLADTKRLRWTGVHEERIKLGSLLTHGILKQAVLMWKHPHVEPSLQNFAKLLHQRIEVVAQVLANWDVEEGRNDAEEALQYHVKKLPTYMHLETLNWLGAFVRGDDQLRDAIEWGNGILSKQKDTTPPIRIDIGAWPEDVVAAAFLQNGQMFVLEELIINAFKYGEPGTTVDVCIRPEPGSRSLTLIVSNQISSLHHRGAGRYYGGTSLVRKVCQQCGWDLKVEEKAKSKQATEVDREVSIYEARIVMPLL